MSTIFTNKNNKETTLTNSTQFNKMNMKDRRSMVFAKSTHDKDKVSPIDRAEARGYAKALTDQNAAVHLKAGHTKKQGVWADKKTGEVVKKGWFKSSQSTKKR